MAIESSAAAPQEFSYPPLEGSSYAVGRTETRQRWWFADGLWLDQGPSSAAVGFCWTHWLADRGVQLPDLGDEYAHELYRAARQETGDDPNEDAGAYVGAAARVLQSRGLVAECYSCPTVPDVVAALLERGPVVAGVVWRSSFDVPEQIDGWAVCRLTESDAMRGGHAILLNGIALDLVIDGVEGFVRLKNSWGRGWGDGGHALVSLADLEQVLTNTEVLLPIPVASALGKELRQEIALEDLDGYSSRVLGYEQSAIGSDLWTTRDTVGAGAYADAIARAIQHPETTPPLTIGIKAPWGAGKTSLMRMIRNRLEWPDGAGEPGMALRELALARDDPGTPRGEVTNRAVLEMIKEKPAADAPAPRAVPRTDDSSTRREEDRWRPTVWFNPWIYQTGEQLWAGLAHEIIDQLTGRMSRTEQERFWLRLNLKRVDQQAVRRKIYSLALERALPYALAGLLLTVGVVLAVILGGVSWLAAVIAPGAAGALAVQRLMQVLTARPGGSVARLTAPVAAVRGFAAGQLDGAYEELVESPDYRRRTGFLYLVNADVNRVLDLVATPRHPLVVFIDDLDRCSPSTVVQVIEAINLFVAGPFPNTIFVVAMEPEVVAAHIEAVYGDLVKQLEGTTQESGQAFDLGWRFLEKIVQLPLALPPMEPAARTTFFSSLFAAAAPDAPPPGAQPASEVEVRAAEQRITEASLSEAVELAGTVKGDGAVGEAVRRVVERKLTADDPEVKEVIAYAAGFLNSNPREIKRFVNLLRFYMIVSTERRIQRLRTPATLVEVAKIAVLGIRWPGLLSLLGRPTDDGGERTLFELLENPPPGAGVAKALSAARVGEADVKRLTGAELRRFLASPPTVGENVRGFL